MEAKMRGVTRGIESCHYPSLREKEHGMHFQAWTSLKYRWNNDHFTTIKMVRKMSTSYLRALIVSDANLTALSLYIDARHRTVNDPLNLPFHLSENALSLRPLVYCRPTDCLRCGVSEPFRLYLPSFLASGFLTDDGLRTRPYLGLTHFVF